MLSKFLKTHPGIYIQPRMGVASIADMAKGLKAVKNLNAPMIGTITIDSYTRLGQYEEAQKALKSKLELNGFPILAYSPDEIKLKVTSISNDDFLIQVRHGTPQPEKIFKQLIASNLYLTEGGPVSYCLPYSRLHLKEAISSWQTACHMLAQYPTKSHLESFGGCLLGQLCHPSILVAIGILEAIFFQKSGIQDISLSYSQQYNLCQDLAAVSALKRLAHIYLRKNIEWHIVIYTFMGLFPQTIHGFEKILEESVQLTLLSGAKRLIVKTQEESVHIPSIDSNLQALMKAYEFSKIPRNDVIPDEEEENTIFTQGKSIIEAVLNTSNKIEDGLYQAFQRGILDVPFCLHPDNHRKAMCTIDDKGYLQWLDCGNLPIRLQDFSPTSKGISMTSGHLLRMLEFNRQKFDNNQMIKP